MTRASSGNPRLSRAEVERATGVALPEPIFGDPERWEFVEDGAEVILVDFGLMTVTRLPKRGPVH